MAFADPVPAGEQAPPGQGGGGLPPALPISNTAFQLATSFVISSVFLLVISIACLGVRVWTRARAGWTFGLDDIFIFISFVGPSEHLTCQFEF